MAYKTDKIEVPISLKADGSNLTQVISHATKQLKEMSSLKAPSITDEKTIRDLQRLVKVLEEVDKKTKKMSELGVKTNVTSEMAKQAASLNDVYKTTQVASQRIRKENESMGKVFSDLQMPINKAETALTRWNRSLMNSVRYNIVNKMVDGVAQGFSDITSYLSETDKNLNNIRIVTGKTNAEMQNVLKSSQAYAKGLSTVTNEYLKASEIYYQQGLSASEVLERTNATIKAANISGQDVAATADQITSVLNGFNLSASETVTTLDKMAALGAGTATDFEEIAKASQKVASAASEAGMGLDETLAMISTISSVTREAPEAVGTSLNAIIGRFNKLTVSEVDNVNSYTSQIQKAFESTASGMSIFEESGIIKDRIKIFNELADKWGGLDDNQRATITTAIAGTRQANKLYALMGNWGEYQEYLEMSKDSEGALADQNDIYAQSLEAIQKNAKLAGETLKNELFDIDTMKSAYEMFEAINTFLAKIAKNAGGLKGTLLPLIALMQNGLMSAIGPVITKMTTDATMANSYFDKTFDAQLQNPNETAQRVLNDENVRLLTYKERQIGLSREMNDQYNKSLEKLRLMVVAEEELNKLKEKTNGLDVGKMQSSILNATKGPFAKSVANESDSIQGQQLDDAREEAEAALRAYEDLQAVIEKQEETLKAPKKSKTYRENIAILDEMKTKALEAGDAYEQLQKSLRDVQFTDLLKGKDKGFVAENLGMSDKFKSWQSEFSDTMKTAFSDEKFTEILNQSTINVDNITQSIGDLFTRDGVLKDGIAEKITPEISKGIEKAILSASDELYGKLDNEISKKTTELTKMQDKNSADVSTSLKGLGDGARIANITSKALQGVTALSTGIKGMSAVMDNSINTQQKLSQGMSAFGATAFSVSGLFAEMNPILAGILKVGGLMLSTLGPLFVEVFGVGIQNTEKLNKQFEALSKSMGESTLAIKEQKLSLQGVETAYNKLAREYQNGTLNLAALTEEQQTNYDQVADYVTKYAPELIKYYDAEGNAVIDLSQQYTDLENSKKSYLRTSMEKNELDTNSRLKSTVGDSGDLVRARFANAQEETVRLTNKVTELNLEIMNGSSKARKELEKVQAELAGHQKVINEVGQDWDTMFSNIVTKGNASFNELSGKLQNLLKEFSGFSNFQTLEGDNGSVGSFQEEVDKIVLAFEQLTPEARTKFEEMNNVVAIAMLNFSTTVKTGMTETLDFLNTVTEQEFMSGDFLADFILRQQAIADASREHDEQKLQESYDNKLRIQEEYETAKNLLEASEEFDPNDTLQTNYDRDIAAAEVAISKQQELLSATADVQKSLLSSYESSTRQMANASAENYNSILESYTQLQDKLAEGIPADESAEHFEIQQERAARMYAVLQGDNEEYYAKWRETNADTINEIGESYGVNADNYATYNEYMAALDDARAKYKLLLEIGVNEGLDAMDTERFRQKKEAAVKEAILNGNSAEAAILMAMSEAESKEYFSNLAAKEALENEKKRIQGLADGSKSSVELNAKEYKALQENGVKLGGFLSRFAEKFKVAGFGTNAIGEETYTSTVDSIVSSIDDRIKDLDSANAEIKKKAQAEANKHKGTIEELANLEKEMQNLQYKGVDYQGLVGKKPLPPSMARPTELNPLGPESGGKDKGAKAKQEKEVEDLKIELDLLKSYKDRIKQINHEIDILKKNREKLYGKDLINNLNQEAGLQRDLLRVEELKLAKAKEIAKVKQDQLAGRGVKFYDDGLIANFNEVITAQQNAANRLSGEAKEKAKKDVQDLKKSMEDYEKYAISAINEGEKSIQKVRFELAKIAQEKIEYPIKLIIDKDKNNATLIDFLADVSKYKKGQIHMSVDANQSASNLVNSLNTLQDMFAQTGNGKDFLNSLFNDPDLQGNTKAQMEMIEKQIKNMEDLGKSLMKFGDEFRESFATALEDASKILENELSKYDNITLQYSRIIELSEALNQNSVKEINAVYGKMADITKNSITQNQKIADLMKESRDAFAVGTEEWMIANEKYLDAQAAVMELEKKLADTMGQRLDKVVTTSRNDLESLLFGGGTQGDAQEALDKMNSTRKRYLDTERGIYELSKLERKIQEDIASNSLNPKAQSSLKKFMDAEMSHLKNKEKLSQHDLDLSEKQYAIIKARIEMEKAREGEKMTLELQRNNDGTFSYMYVKDMEGAKKAQQAYEDAIDQLYQYSIKRTEELQQESINIRGDALSQFDKIIDKMRKGTLTEEEAVQQLNEAFKEMGDRLRENAKQQAEMQKQVASSKLLQILGVTEEELGSLDDLESSITSIMDTLAARGEVNGLSSVLTQLGLDANNYTGSVGEQMAQMFRDLGGDKGAMEMLMKAFADTGDSTVATILGLLGETGDLAQITEDILENSLNGAGDKFDEYIEKISKGELNPEDIFTESIINGLDQVEVTWDSLKDIIAMDLDSLLREFDISNPDGALSEVVSNIQNAYQEYNKVLSDSYDKLKDNEKELEQATNQLNNKLNTTVNKIRDEIREVTEVTKKYANLRKEVLAAIADVTKYINILNDAKKQIENNKKPNSTVKPGGSSGSGSDSKGSGSGSSGGNAPGQGLGSGKRVRILGSQVFMEASGGSPLPLDGAYRNSSRTDLQIDGSAYGRYRVKQKGAGYVGWFNPSMLQAFHSGGKVGINKDEGLAVLQKNEAVITESQVDTIKRLKNIIGSMQDQASNLQANPVNNNSNVVYNIQAELPNVTNAEEFVKSLEDLSSGASQYVGKKRK